MSMQNIHVCTSEPTHNHPCYIPCMKTMINSAYFTGRVEDVLSGCLDFWKRVAVSPAKKSFSDTNRSPESLAGTSKTESA